MDDSLETRKKDHIELALASQVEKTQLDRRFYYEPLLKGHPNEEIPMNFELAGKTFQLPIWVSSMTGGTQKAGIINRNLAKACGEFGMGMGLGSCRILLEDDTYLEDFQVRKYMPEQALYANIGIAQLEEMAENDKLGLIQELIKKLEADGIIIHINPLQEWFQDEGDRILHKPIETIKRFIDSFDGSIIVKEVGQGMGYESLKALYQLPLDAVEFAAGGGTNFSKLEILRKKMGIPEEQMQLALVGHTALEMTEMTNKLKWELGASFLVNRVIISGGVQSFLDGYHLIQTSNIPAVYGQASAFLKQAQDSYENLAKYVSSQKDGLRVAYNYLKVKASGNGPKND